MPHRIHRVTKVYFIRSPHPCFYRGPPSGHTSPLVYFNRVFFLITSVQLVEENQAYLGRRENRQVKIDDRLVKDHLRGVGVTEISICKSSTALSTAAVEGARESGMPFPTRVSPHLGTLR
jgi:hypothetical protein